MHTSFTVKAAAFYGCMTAVAVVLIVLRDGWGLFVSDATSWDLFAQVLIGIAVGGVGVFLSRAAVAHFAWARVLCDELRCLVGHVSASQALIMAMASAIGEEALFRGVLQPSLGLWFASLVFAVLHIGPSVRFWPWPLMAFVAGLVFGSLFDVTGSLVAPIFAHATVNFLNLRYLASRPEQVELHLEPVADERWVGML